jgi:basic membrane lipoprotein Med (substrate-binding protein (PBP1-ABC) superfamily)
MRDERIAKMKERYAEEQENRINGHGKYSEITEEEFLPTVTKTKFVIVHFYHKDFERCKIFDMHLKSISFKHQESKFVTLDAEKCPFFIAKL